MASKRVKIKRTKKVKCMSITLKHGGASRLKRKDTGIQRKQQKYQEIVADDILQLSKKQNALTEFNIHETQLHKADPTLIEGVKNQVLDKMTAVKNFKEKFPRRPVIDIFNDYDNELGIVLDIKNLIRDKESHLLPGILPSEPATLSNELLAHYKKFLYYKTELIIFAKMNLINKNNKPYLPYLSANKLANLLLLYDAMKAYLKLEYNKNNSESNVAVHQGDITESGNFNKSNEGSYNEPNILAEGGIAEGGIAEAVIAEGGNLR
jgi:hypothetical protein